MPSSKRFKFHGSRIQVLTSWATGKSITAATKANPGVVTMVAHGLAVGQIAALKVAGALGMTELNGFYLVKGLTVDTVELIDTDTTGYGTYTSGGSGQQSVLSNWCEVTNISRQGGSKAEIKTNSVCSVAEEIELDIPVYGSLTFQTYYADTAIQAALEAAYDSGDIFPISYQPKGMTTRTMLIGFVQSLSEQAGNGGVWTGNVGYRITGRPARTAVTPVP